MRASTRRSSSGLLKLAETKGLPEATVALLKILALGERDVEQGKLPPLADVIEEGTWRFARRTSPRDVMRG